MKQQLSEHERQECRKNIRKLYVYKCLGPAMALAAPVIVIFWRSFGLSMIDVVILQLVFSIALGLFEVPSGYLADSWGRARTMAIGMISMAIAAGLYLVSDGFAGFLVSELFFAFGLAMISGADQALLYDTLQSLGEAESFSKIWGRMTCIEMIGAGLYGILGGLIYSFSPRLPYGLAAMMFLILALVLRSVCEPTRAHHCRESRSYSADIMYIMSRYVLASPRLMLVFVWSGVLVASLQCAFWLYQPYWEGCEIPVRYFGFLFAGLSLVSAVSAAQAHRWSRRFGEMSCLLVATVILALSFVAAFLLGGIALGAVVLFSHQLVRGGMRIWIPELINREVPSEVRATVISVRGLHDRLVYGVMLLPLGYSAEAVGADETYLWMGVLLFSSIAVGSGLAIRRRFFMVR